jgi:hypothetical protein
MVAAIPASRIPQAKASDDAPPWECLRSEPCGEPCHWPSSPSNSVTMELATVNDENPCDNRGSGVICPPLAPDGTKGGKWRRRESNPCVSSRKWRDLQALVERELEVAALALHSDGPDWHSLSPDTLELAELITCWPQLPEPIRQIILTLVRSVKMPEQDVIDSAEPNRAGERVIIP